MYTDYLDLENAEGMRQMADSSFALDFLLTVKNGVRNYAVAITETTNPELRRTLTNQLEVALDLHDELSELMIKHGWLLPYDIKEQQELDIKAADMAVWIGKMELFPGDTSRLGTFATPEK
jgi:similar to spore coat protein